jgi:hypothetical protein
MQLNSHSNKLTPFHQRYGGYMLLTVLDLAYTVQTRTLILVYCFSYRPGIWSQDCTQTFTWEY